jgi:hypothetical protein
MMTETELDALERVVSYTLMNEEISYEEWVAEGGNPNDHIYRCAQALSDYVRGLHSTGNIK